MDFEAASEPLDRGIHVVSVRGEVDLATGPAFDRALGEVPEDGVESVIVDLTDCSFMDSTGLHLLTRTHQRLGGSGGQVAVVSANRSVLRLFGLTGLDKLFPIYPSRAAALNGHGNPIARQATATARLRST
jgi:anti-sigma B factor antagonist